MIDYIDENTVVGLFFARFRMLGEKVVSGFGTCFENTSLQYKKI